MRDGFLHQQFALLDRDYFESLDRYLPSDELLRVVRQVVPPTWRIDRSGFWFRVLPRDVRLPDQGWKIHISALPSNCTEVLSRTAAVCIAMGSAFKFALDRRLLTMSCDKNWARESSGKFITVYPQNDEHFLKIIDSLHTTLGASRGPYVLSDRSYRDSRAVYYRFGGISGALRKLTPDGDFSYTLVSPSGDTYPDWRTPYWYPPPWVDDPFQPEEDESTSWTSILKDGRYQVENALAFSVTGGVYLATDLDSGQSVVIKEARPNAAVDQDGRDAIARLEKEHRLLQDLADTGITPRPIDLFWDWEHAFLVEEFIPGLDLGLFTVTRNPMVRARIDRSTRDSYVELLTKIWTNLALAVAALHDRGVILGDLSIKNVMIPSPDVGEVRLIDLEGAWTEGRDAQTKLATTGFSSPGRRSGGGTKEDDVYSLGATMLGTLFPINNFLDINPSARSTFARFVERQLGLPSDISRIVLACMSDSPADRPVARTIPNLLTRAQSGARPTGKCSPDGTSIAGADATERLQEVVEKVADHIVSTADPHRHDRLFPADPRVFFTNPLSVAHGATGVAYALARLGMEIPATISSWILARSVSPEAYPPGLYLGSSGIAWALWECGHQETAVQIMRAAHDHPLLQEASDIFLGAAGYGLTCLRLYLGTKDQSWLESAARIGESLVRSRIQSDDGCYWPDKEGNTWLGYARGASGVSLFLLYLGIATAEHRFTNLAETALAFDLSHLRATDEGHLSVPRGAVGSLENVLSHYWLDGSAGVVSVLVRMWCVTRKSEYEAALTRLLPDVCRTITTFPGLFLGLSGLGHALLDAYDFTGDEHYLQQARQTAEGVLLFKMTRPSGYAFPGEQLLRVSTDLGTGSSGIALFLDRLARATTRPGNSNFLLDELLVGSAMSLRSAAEKVSAYRTD